MENEVVATAPVGEEVVLEKQTPQFSKTEDKAIEQGWVPKEDFQGEEHKWVAADEFLRRGELFGKIDTQNRELKETKKALAALQDHYLKVQETEYKRAFDTLKKQKKAALIEGDVEAVLDADTEIEKLRDDQLAEAKASAMAQQQEQASQPHPAFVAWTAKNSWYETNRPMRAFADAMGVELKEAGRSPTEVLHIVALEVRKKFSDRFTNPRRDEASSVEGGVSKGSTGKRDAVVLTEIEATMMKKLIGNGVLTKEQYIADIKKQRERS